MDVIHACYAYAQATMRTDNNRQMATATLVLALSLYMTYTQKENNFKGLSHKNENLKLSMIIHPHHQHNQMVDPSMVCLIHVDAIITVARHVFTWSCLHQQPNQHQVFSMRSDSGRPLVAPMRYTVAAIRMRRSLTISIKYKIVTRITYKSTNKLQSFGLTSFRTYGSSAWALVASISLDHKAVHLSCLNWLQSQT